MSETVENVLILYTATGGRGVEGLANEVSGLLIEQQLSVDMLAVPGFPAARRALYRYRYAYTGRVVIGASVQGSTVNGPSDAEHLRNATRDGESFTMASIVDLPSADIDSAFPPNEAQEIARNLVFMLSMNSASRIVSPGLTPEEPRVVHVQPPPPGGK